MTPECDNIEFLGFDIGKLEQDPSQPVVIDVDHIDPYDGNSRLIHNAKRAELKQITLRDGGAPGHLVATRRPGSARLVLARGGNTRLDILKELRREFPDDPRWRKVSVWFEAYVSELQLALNAYQENDSRGELLFIERARAFCRVFDLWSALQVDRRRATLQEFLVYFTANLGKPPSASVASRMRFAVDKLYPVIPTVLVAGQMTLRAVRRLIEYHNKIADLWVTAKFGPAEEFDGYFYEHLRRQEKELAATAARLAAEAADEDFVVRTLRIDYDQLSAALAREMACVEHVTVDEELIGEWIEAVLSGTPTEYIAAAEPADGSTPNYEALKALGYREQRIDYESLGEQDFVEAGPVGSDRAVRHVSETPNAPATKATPAPAAAHGIADYREGAFRAAQRIAARNRFQHLLIEYPYGVGYLLADTIVQGNDERVPLSRAAPWWILVSCGLILDLPPAIANANLPEASLLRGSIEGRQPELISHVMGPPWALGRYLAALDDLDSQDFMVLLGLAREIIRLCGDDGFPWIDVR